MSTNAELRKLKLQRAGVRGQVTTLLGADSKTCDIHKYTLKLGDYDKRLQELDDKIQSQMEDEKELEKDIKGGLEIHESIMDFQSEMQSRQVGVSRVHGERNDNCDDALSVRSAGSNAKARAKTPKIKFQPFTGNPLEWQPFWDRFSVAVDQNNEMFDVDKFVLLTTLLTEEANQVIKGLAITAENYQVAVSLLYDRYGKEQIVTNAHMEAIIDIQKVCTPSGLRTMYDAVEVHLRGMEALGKTLDGMMLAPLILKKLPEETRLFLSRELGDNLWDLEKLREALGAEVQARERMPIQNSHWDGFVSERGATTVGKTSTFVAPSRPLTCIFCDRGHKAVDCPLGYGDRKRSATERKLCFICLGRDHMFRSCRSKGTCRNCHKRWHHTALCNPVGKYGGNNCDGGENKEPRTKQAEPRIYRPQKPEGSVSKTDNQRGVTSTNALLSYASKTVLMKTAVAEVSAGEQHANVGIIFDDASQLTYITSKVAEQLGANPLERVRTEIAHFRAKSGVPDTNAVVGVKIRCRDGISRFLEAIVVDSISPKMYRCQVDAGTVTELKGMELADPLCITDSTFEVGLLIGGVHYYDFIDGDIRRIPGGLVATSSRLGWVLTGPATRVAGSSPSGAYHSFFVKADLVKQFERLNDIETLGITHEQDKVCSEVLQQFRETVQYHDNRYWVRFPWKPEKVDLLGDNRCQALSRFRSLQRKLRQDHNLAKKYADVIKDQEKRGFIERVENESTVEGVLHYIPHHPVVKGDSRTTKVRVVYDGSSKSAPHGIAINETQFEGPNLIGDMFQILLQFRFLRVGITSDVEKAFLQLGLQSVDRDCTRFFWSESLDGFGFMVYRFTRVLFGFVSSPYLLNATLNHHLTRDGSEAALLILNSTYVDNCIVSRDTFKEAELFYTDAKRILAAAGMNLREWASNEKQFVEGLPGDDKVRETRVKVLGLQWDTETDVLRLNFKGSTVAPVTKRLVLHVISSVFDPLGFASPVTIRGRIFLQKLWQQGIGWDDDLSQCLQDEWIRIQDQLQELETITVPRWCGTRSSSDIELHGFADASPEAYCAVVYGRLERDTEVKSFFLAAKARVAPAKKRLTIPKLELMAVLICTRLCKSIQKALGSHISSTTVWSDSMVALAWVRQGTEGIGGKDVFVRNRVTEILGLHANFEYVRGEENPADLGTRSASSVWLPGCDFWWFGPRWFSRGEPNPEKVQPLKAITCIAETGLHKDKGDVTEAQTPFEINVERYGSLQKLYGATAMCLKVWYRFRGRRVSQVELLREARLRWDRWVQRASLGELYLELITKAGRNASKTGLFLDNDGLIRRKGRMQNASLPEETKTPVLLPKRNVYTTLVIRKAHDKVLHQGVAQTVVEVLQEYSIPRCKQAVKTVIRRCVQCRKQNANAYPSPPQAPLPYFRVEAHPPFTYVGVDFAGPVPCRDAKVWICLFTCAATRALHLELVDSLSTTEFIVTLRKFIARRGTPKRMISDNAQTFKLAKSVLVESWKCVIESDEVGRYTAGKNIEWQFNVERAPWWGGFFERMVGLVKRCLRKCVGSGFLTKSELEVQLFEIEAVLNSRPLTHADGEIGNKPICPNDALGIRNPQSFPLQTLDEGPSYVPNENSVQAVIKRIALTQQFVNSFWKRWKHEYLVQLREHHYPQGKGPHIAPTVGEVVLIKDDTPRNQWRLGLIERLITGKDGFIRAAQVKTKTTTLQRPIQLLIPLEIRSKESRNDKIETPHLEAEQRSSAVQENEREKKSTTKSHVETRTKRRAAIEAERRLQRLAREDDDDIPM